MSQIEKRQEQQKKLLLEEVKKTPIVNAACKRAGIGRATYYRWMKQDEEFALAIEEAMNASRQLVNDMAEAQLISAIKDQNMTAIIFWLKNNHKSYENRVNVQGTIKHQAEALTETQSAIVEQVKDIPIALKEVRGGKSLIIVAGIVGAITFSAKEIISSFNSIYDVDIALIGLIAAAAMAGRIVGTALEKRLDVSPRLLIVVLSILVGFTAVINLNRAAGIVLVLLSTVVAQMLFYRLRYQLSSEAPKSHVASLVSALSLVGRLASGGIIMLTGVFAGLGYFHLSFVAMGLTLVFVGIVLSSKLVTD